MASFCGRETILNKICRKIGNKGENVKDIPYVVKEKAATHYMWLAAFSHKAKKSVAAAICRTPLGDLGLTLRRIDRLIAI